MSLSREAVKVEELEFKWGKKRGVGGKNKGVQFYESFTYDGVDYALYDDVFMYKEGESAPYIGKLLKIWETAEKSKKLKVHWYFQPAEISYYLRDVELLKNELFFASGVGTGLANINQLEAIAGKCNVVCISKDSRNPQPSAEELQMADYVFYRTFDVKSCTISAQMGDTVGGLEVTFVFNRKESDRTLDFHKLDSCVKDDERNAVACNETPKLEGKNSPQYMKNAKPNESHYHIQEKESTDEKQGQVKHESSRGGAKNVSLNKESAPLGVNYSEDREAIGSGEPNQVQVENVVKFTRKSSSLDDSSSKRAKVDGTFASTKVKNSSAVQTKIVPGNNAKQLVNGAITSNVQSCSDLVKNSVGLGKDVKFAKNSISLMKKPLKKSADSSKEKSNFGDDAHHDISSSLMKKPLKISADLSKEKSNIGDDAHHNIKNKKLSKDSRDVEGGCAKKAKYDSSTKIMEDNNKNIIKKLKRIGASDTKKIPTIVNSNEGELKSRSDNAPSKEHHNKKAKANALSKVDSPKLSVSTSKGDKKVEGQIFEVTQRPLDGKNSWIKLSWEERMKAAHDQGTLVLLLNLDSEYTSGEIEDIIWHAFNEYCTARMVQHTAISSPHSGKAFVIFRTREVVQRVLQKLDDGCLMLPNHRPLVGCTGAFPKIEKQTKFFGHLDIDKARHQIQRELKEAVSTSHYSQNNTIEYEMAMAWCLLRAKSDKWWEKLYEQQRKNLWKITSGLKSK